MSECEFCGKKERTPYSCNYCGITLCSNCRLPENHNCVGLQYSNANSEHFASDAPSTIGNTSKNSGVGNEPQKQNEKKKENRRTVGTASEDDIGESPPPVTIKEQKKSENSDAQDTQSLFETTKIRLYAASIAFHSSLASIVMAPFVALSYIFGLGKKLASGLLSFVFSVKFVFGILVATVVISATVGTGIPLVDNAVSNPLEAGDEVASEVSSFANDATSVNKTELKFEIHEEVNQRRGEYGVESLQYLPRLEKAASQHSKDMVEKDYFSHVSPAGETFMDRYQKYDAGCSSGGENIYRTDDSATDEEGLAKDVVDGWMESKGHRKNILREQFKAQAIGIAIGDYEGEKNVVITQNFC